MVFRVKHMTERQTGIPINELIAIDEKSLFNLAEKHGYTPSSFMGAILLHLTDFATKEFHNKEHDEDYLSFIVSQPIRTTEIRIYQTVETSEGLPKNEIN